MPTPTYRLPFWFDRVQYRDALGRFVSERDVRNSVEQMQARLARDVDALAARLRRGDISLARWQDDMARLLKHGHVAAEAAARGGLRHLTQADYGRIGARLRYQYQRLAGFAADIAAGKVPLGAALRRRAALYAAAVWTTYQSGRADLLRERGFTEYRNVLGVADHCPDCQEATDRGWVETGTLTPIGERQCMVNCQCHYEYRNPRTGKVLS